MSSHHTAFRPTTSRSPVPHATIIVTGLLHGVVYGGGVALVVEAYREAEASRLLVTSPVVDPSGRRLSFACFLPEEEDSPGDRMSTLFQFQTKLVRLRAGRVTFLEWAVVHHGQARGCPESVSGSYEHGYSRP